MQGTPAGLPFGIPGIGLLILGAVQQAPQCVRHIIGSALDVHCISGRHVKRIGRRLQPSY